MKKDALTSIEKSAPPPPARPENRESVRTRDTRSMSADAALAKVAPEIKDEKVARERVEAVAAKLTTSGSKGLEAAGNIDAERVKALLSDE